MPTTEQCNVFRAPDYFGGRRVDTLYCSIARTRHAANGEQLAGPSAQARRTTRSLATEGIREKAQAGPSPGVVIRGGLFALSLTFAQPHPRASAAVLVDEDHAGGF